MHSTRALQTDGKVIAIAGRVDCVTLANYAKIF